MLLVNLGAERFSLGWYFNRTLGLLTSSLLLLALVWASARVSRSAYDPSARAPTAGATSRPVLLAAPGRACALPMDRGHAAALPALAPSLQIASGSPLALLLISTPTDTFS